MRKMMFEIAQTAVPDSLGVKVKHVSRGSASELKKKKLLEQINSGFPEMSGVLVFNGEIELIRFQASKEKNITLMTCAE